MRKQKQLLRHDPDNGVYGDCYRTCVAAILNLEASDVPHFADPTLEKRGPVSRAKEWLSQYGLTIFQMVWESDNSLETVLATMAHLNSGVPFILIGTGAEGVGHCVVYSGEETVCDPSGSGIEAPLDGYWWCEVIAVVDLDRAQKLSNAA